MQQLVTVFWLLVSIFSSALLSSLHSPSFFKLSFKKKSKKKQIKNNGALISDVNTGTVGFGFADACASDSSNCFLAVGTFK